MKKYKPTTPSLRQKTVVEYRKFLTRSKPHKSLVVGRKRAVGRNSQGRITTRHKGAGAKRAYRIIDFLYDKRDIPARVESIEYDPNRTAFVGLVVYADGERRYTVIPANVRVGDSIIVSQNAPLKPGNRLPLKNIPVGSFVYNIELQPGVGARLVRSAGVWAEILAHEGKYTNIKLPSSEIRKVLGLAWASIGSSSNPEHRFVTIGKAGRSRLMGKRPTVRGSAMNPADHPYGGGEGRAKRGTRRPKTKWGKVTGGRKTRRKKKYSDAFIISRRSKK